MKSKRPLVSVIINTYNYGRFIEEAVDSVLNQTFPQENMEIIVVDDGSTDDTRERLKKYQNKINYIYKENGGHASALNVGFNNSRGEIIIFLDSDDYFCKDKIEYICKYYDKYGCKTLFNNMTLFWERTDKTENFIEDYYLTFLKRVDESVYKLSLKDITHSFIFLAPTSGQTYKREICEKLFPLPEMLLNQGDLYLHIHALLYYDIYYLHKPLTCMRQHQGSYTSVSKKDAEKQESIIDIGKFIINDLSRYRYPKTENLTRILKNMLYLSYFNLEKLRGNKTKAFMYLLKYRNEGSTLYKMFNKLSLTISLILPGELYDSLRRSYFKYGLITLRRKILKDKTT